MQNSNLSEQPSENKKIVLLVEDDSRIGEHLTGVIKEKYWSAVTVTNFRNAGEVVYYYLNQEKAGFQPDALILDLMMPYDTARSLLDPSNSDPEENDTGLRLLKWLRDFEMERKLNPVWIAIITARSPFAVKASALKLLKDRGEIYWKPFNTLILQDRLMREIGVPSLVPPALLSVKISSTDTEDEEEA